MIFTSSIWSQVLDCNFLGSRANVVGFSLWVPKWHNDEKSSKTVKPREQWMPRSFCVIPNSLLTNYALSKLFNIAETLYPYPSNEGVDQPVFHLDQILRDPWKNFKNIYMKLIRKKMLLQSLSTWQSFQIGIYFSVYNLSSSKYFLIYHITLSSRECPTNYVKKLALVQVP